MSSLPTLPTELAEWHETLDTAIASVALNKDDSILAIGCADDIRNMLSRGVELSRGWSTVTTVTKTDITSLVIRVDRSPKYWNVCQSYKDAHRLRRKHLHLHVTLERPATVGNRFTSDRDLLTDTANISTLKFLTLFDVVKIVVIMPFGVKLPDELTIHHQINPNTTMKIIASTICCTLDSLQLGNRPFETQWDRYVSHGFAKQVRCDFGVTTCEHELERMILSIVSEMKQQERAGQSAQSTQTKRYATPSNVKQKLNVFLQRPFVLSFGDHVNANSLDEDLAYILLRSLENGSGLSFEISGLSSATTLIRTSNATEVGLRNILKAADVLKSIRQHQQGGVVRRAIWCQFLAIGWVIISVGVSILVGAADLGNRGNVYERLSDTASTATLLLVSLFGLIKLTSEDTNAIKNTLQGYRVLRNIRDVKSFFKHNTCGVSLGLALAAVDMPLHWLADGNTSYMLYKPLGSIVFTEGVSSFELIQLGMLFGPSLMLDYRRGRTMKVSDGGSNNVHLDGQIVDSSCLKAGTEIGFEDYAVG